MKVYLLFQNVHLGEGTSMCYPYVSRLQALATFENDLKEYPSSRWLLHEIDMDPEAGFQTVNITQLNSDGTRQDEEYRSEQQELTRQFNTANPIT